MVDLLVVEVVEDIQIPTDTITSDVGPVLVEWESSSFTIDYLTLV